MYEETCPRVISSEPPNYPALSLNERVWLSHPVARLPHFVEFVTQQPLAMRSSKEKKWCPLPMLLLPSGSGLPGQPGVVPRGPKPPSSPPPTSQRRLRPRRPTSSTSHLDNKGRDIKRATRTDAISRYLSRGCCLVCMVLPLRVLGVPFAGRGSSTDPGGTTSLDFAVSGEGSRLQGLKVTSLAAVDTGAPSESEASRDGGRGRTEGELRDRTSAADEWAGFVVKDGPVGQVREACLFFYPEGMG